LYRKSLSQNKTVKRKGIEKRRKISKNIFKEIRRDYRERNRKKNIGGCTHRKRVKSMSNHTQEINVSQCPV
jgi:hypothetical protein